MATQHKTLCAKTTDRSSEKSPGNSRISLAIKVLCGAKILLLTDLPERKKPCAIENSAQCPLNFFIADVESRA